MHAHAARARARVHNGTNGPMGAQHSEAPPSDAIEEEMEDRHGRRTRRRITDTEADTKATTTHQRSHISLFFLFFT